MIQLQVTIKPQTTSERDTEHCREVAQAVIEKTRLGESSRCRGINKAILILSNENLVEELTEDFSRNIPKSLIYALELIAKTGIRSKIERKFLGIIKSFKLFRKYKSAPDQRNPFLNHITSHRKLDEGIFSATHKKLIPTEDGKSDDLLSKLLHIVFCSLISGPIYANQNISFY